jgi:MFS family permease
MRGSGFASIAIVESAIFSGSSASLVGSVIVPCYAAAELVTAMAFGAMSDKIGRKPVLILGHFLAASFAFLFIFSNESIGLMLGFAALFGVRAAAEVSSALTMISDMSTLDNRAEHIGIFDMTTLGGLAGGFVVGVMLMNVLLLSPSMSLIIMGSLVLVSVILVFLLVGETKSKEATSIGVLGLFRKVFSNRDIVRLLPVYTPIICLYGLIIAFAENIAESGNIFSSTQSLTTLRVVGLCLIAGLLVLGRLSDYVLRRKPFIDGGPFCGHNRCSCTFSCR